MKRWHIFEASWRLKVVSVVLLAVVGALIWQRQTHSAPQTMADESRLDILHARCVQDMVANTCKIKGTMVPSETVKSGDLVFVAGFGPIDAVDYQQMHSAGEAMCAVVYNACVKEWDGRQCKTARALYQP